MDNVPRNKVDVVVTETEVRISYPISSELVQFGLLHPLAALWGGGGGGGGGGVVWSQLLVRLDRQTCDMGGS